METPSTITSHQPGYIDKPNEVIVGYKQMHLEGAIKPNGGIRLVENAAEAFGYEIPKNISKIYYEYRKTHNDGVFDAYSLRSGIYVAIISLQDYLTTIVEEDNW